MLGNGDWAERGVPILAKADSPAHFESDGAQSLQLDRAVLRDRADGTALTGPSETFEDRRTLEIGDMTIEVLHLGDAERRPDL